VIGPGFKRLIPALAVTALLCLAAAAPGPPQPMPAPPPIAAPCTDFSHTGDGDSTVVFMNGDGILQPLPAGVTAVGCSLSVNGDYYAFAVTSVHEWDPTSLAPDPQTVALRTETITPSAFTSVNGFAVPWLSFVPPVITRSLQGVAEPPRSTVAVQVLSATLYDFATHIVHYAPEGSPEMPPASMVAAGGTHGSLVGSHPVVAHALCGGDEDVQSLRIVQSVRRTDVALTDRPDEIVQSFRVPERVDLRWIELAIADPSTAAANGSAPQMPAPPPPPPTVVAIVDPAGATEPPTNMPASLVEAVFQPSTFIAYSIYQPPPTWASHLDFDHRITLQPGRDYWLYVRSASSQKFLGRSLTGSESGDFTSGVGALHTRSISVDGWTPIGDKVLAFKIVGRPAATTPVPHQPGGFLVRLAPNPATDIAQVTWSGAVGPVHVEVFDARGRRMAQSDGGAAGTWAWSMTGRDGRLLPAGAYFVRARDSAGQTSNQRVMIVR
jgi:hypothetical protein